MEGLAVGLVVMRGRQPRAARRGGGHAPRGAGWLVAGGGACARPNTRRSQKRPRPRPKPVGLREEASFISTPLSPPAARAAVARVAAARAVYAVYAISSLDTGSSLRHGTQTAWGFVGTHQGVAGLTPRPFVVSAQRFWAAVWALGPLGRRARQDGAVAPGRCLTWKVSARRRAINRQPCRSSLRPAPSTRHDAGRRSARRR